MDLFNFLFGPGAGVGDGITAEAVLFRISQSASMMNDLMNTITMEWKKKGVVVECLYDTAAPERSMYILKKLPE